MNKKIIISTLVILGLLAVTVIFMMNLSNKETVNPNKFADDPIEEVDMNELIVEEESDFISLDDENESKDKDVITDLDKTKDLNNINNEEIVNKEEDVEETPLFKINKDVYKNEKPKAENVSNVKKDGYKPLTIYFKNQAVPYENAGTNGAINVINESNKASTWGGVSTFSGTDGQNTHFIGHYNKQFENIAGTDKFVITDTNGESFTYVTTAIYEVDEYGIGIEDGIDYWERITGTSGGERIVIQTSTGKQKEKLIIEASIQ